jgi:histidine triad (HIT) family protein
VIPSLFRRAQQITKAISEALEPDGINLVMNNGAAAGQSVFHCHLHIIPRFNHDEFKFRLHFKKYQSEQRSEFGKLIRECL